MKKIFLFAASFLFFTSLKAQVCGGPALLNEKFDNGIPGNWTVLDLDGDVPSASMIHKGFTGHFQPYVHLGQKCVANTSQLSLGGPANDYIITPGITLGSGPICLSWKGASPGDDYQVKLSTLGATPADMNAAFNYQTVTNENEQWTEHSIDISFYAGQTVYIGFHHISAGSVLYLDDIRISQPVNRDASVTSLIMQDVVAPGSEIISGKLINAGTSPLTSLTLNWNVNNGSANSVNISSINVAAGSYYNYSHTINWNPSTNGIYYLRVWADAINGSNDQYPQNDTLVKIIFVNTYHRKVLLEEFTQASCHPCGIANPRFDSIYTPNIYNNMLSSVHYQVSWPGYDPMNLFNPGDVIGRVDYYGISYVPTAIIDGAYVPNNCSHYMGAPDCLTQINIDNAYAVPSIFDIQVSNTPIGNTMNVTVQVTAKTDFPLTTFRLFTVAIEDTISYTTAPGTNGETKFYQVMRKILPDSSGQQLSAMANNQIIAFNYSYPIDTVFALNEMRTVAFIQDDVSRKVYQSATNSPHNNTGMNDLAEKYNVSIFPNPTQGTIFIHASNISNENLNWQLVSVLGSTVLSGRCETINGSLSKTIDISTVPAGIYFLELMPDGGMVTMKIIKE